MQHNIHEAVIKDMAHDMRMRCICTASGSLSFSLSHLLHPSLSHTAFQSSLSVKGCGRKPITIQALWINLQEAPNSQSQLSTIILILIQHSTLIQKASIYNRDSVCCSRGLLIWAWAVMCLIRPWNVGSVSDLIYFICLSNPFMYFHSIKVCDVDQHSTDLAREHRHNVHLWCFAELGNRSLQRIELLWGCLDQISIDYQLIHGALILVLC